MDRLYLIIIWINSQVLRPADLFYLNPTECIEAMNILVNGTHLPQDRSKYDIPEKIKTFDQLYELFQNRIEKLVEDSPTSDDTDVCKGDSVISVGQLR